MNFTIRKRMFMVLLFVTSALLTILIRLAWLQLFDGVPKAASAHGRQTSEMAVLQRQTRMELDPGRGRFVDASGNSLTSQVVLAPVLFPVRGQAIEALSDKKQELKLQELAKLLSTTTDKLEAVHGSLKQPAYWTDSHGSNHTPLSLSPAQAAKLEHLNINWVKPLPILQRYADAPSGKQWLGFVAEQPELVQVLNQKQEVRQQSKSELQPSVKLGAAGLEKTFDRLLRGEGSTGVSYLIDGRRGPLSQEALRVRTADNPYYPLTVKTTIDVRLQNTVERLAVQKGVKEGAIVVLDAASGDIKAMVSLPFYNPNQVNPQKSAAWSNRAVQEAVPGSIFKTVTAAAALETGAAKPGEHFFCSGDYGKYGLSCSKKAGHGDITFARGFAESCNTVFGRLGERISPVLLQRTADALGLGRKVGWEQEVFMDGQPLNQIDQEETGTVFGHEANPGDGGVRVQTAIGQRSARVSPLQAANLIVTLLHDGTVQAPRLVSGISYANGTDMVEFKPHQTPAASGQISSRTARTLVQWMRMVVTDGTGKKLKQAKWELAGKSGTAQVTRDGKALNDQWFIGFGPYKIPKYTAAVLVQSREPGSVHLATELFGAVMDSLADSDRG